MLQDERSILCLLSSAEVQLAERRIWYEAHVSRRVLDGEGVSSDGSTTSVGDMHPEDTDTRDPKSKMSCILRCQKRPDPRGDVVLRASVGVQSNLGSKGRRKAVKGSNLCDSDVSGESKDSTLCGSDVPGEGSYIPPASRILGSCQPKQCDHLCELCGDAWCRWPRSHTGKRHLCFQCEAGILPPGPIDSFSESLTIGRGLLAQSPDSSASKDLEGKVIHTPQSDGASSLARRVDGSSAETGSSLSHIPVSELVQLSNSRLEVVGQLLSDCFRASHANEQRLSQLCRTQKLVETHTAQLTGRLTHQASLLEQHVRGGGSVVPHRFESTSSRNSKGRAHSAGPTVRYVIE